MLLLLEVTSYDMLNVFVLSVGIYNWLDVRLCATLGIPAYRQ